jgi:4-hydroxybenzoate polyprenyltransferase
MATSVATGALKPKVAVTLSAILNLLGAFLSIQVALPVSNKIISIQGPNGAPVPGLMGVLMLVIILAGLVGGILVESAHLAVWTALVLFTCIVRRSDRCDDRRARAEWSQGLGDSKPDLFHAKVAWKAQTMGCKR